MIINEKILKKIDEAKYLATENTYRYRAIMRYFYNQYEKFNYWIYRDDVYDALKKNDIFQDYTVEQCSLDLEALKEWKNLSAVQDTSKASSIEEFKNKQYRYQMTEYAREIERMTIRLENLFVEGASLQPNLLERIRDEIKSIKELISNGEDNIGIWWQDLKADFERLNQNYQDYIREWQSVKADEMMKTKSFLSYKDKFIEYLRTFVKNLQENVQLIEVYINDISKEEEEILIGRIIEYEKSIPRIDLEDIDEKGIKDNIWGQWFSIKHWFLGTSSRISESEQLFEISNEIIRKITRYAAQIIETANQAANRKEEYRKIAELFINCSNVERAYHLSAYVFGIERPKHLKADMIRKTDSINSSVYNEESYSYTVRPRIRAYREKAQRSPIKEYKDQQKKVLEDVLKKRKEELNIIKEYTINGVLNFEELNEINSNIRNILLRWLSNGLNNKNYKGKTENGVSFYIQNPKESNRTVLKCDDGMLNMPAYKIVFEGE